MSWKTPSLLSFFPRYDKALALWLIVFIGIWMLPVTDSTLRLCFRGIVYPAFLFLAVQLLYTSFFLPFSESVWVLCIGCGLGTSYGISVYGKHILFSGIRSPLLLFTASGIAILLVRRIERPWHLAVAGLVGLVADLWSVFSSSGVTRKLLEEAPELLNYLLLDFSLPANTVMPVMGVADFAFMGIMVLSADKFSLGTEKNLFYAALSLLITLLLVNLLGIGLPAIPLMAVFFVVVNRRGLIDSFMADYRNNFGYTVSKEEKDTKPGKLKPSEEE